MKIGFGRNDITPRVGVELSGFGPYLCRKSIAVRDNLFARAMAVENQKTTLIIVSIDLVGITKSLTKRIRCLVSQRTGIAEQAVMLCATHTHSGPSIGNYIGWGEADTVYLETLPFRISKACVEAFMNLKEARLFHAEVPCEGIGLNREYEDDGPPLDTVLQEGWRPAKPELTDTTCHVLTAQTPEGKFLGFLSYFGCHPVTCSEDTRYIHGDYPGIATNNLEREYPGSVGLFFQGASGDVNTCAVHKPEDVSMKALDILAARYAKSLRDGIRSAVPLSIDSIKSYSKDISFSRKEWGREKLRELLIQKEERVLHDEATDIYKTENWDIKLETVFLKGLQRLVAAEEKGEDPAVPTEIQGIRLGPVTFLASGFEVMQMIKNDVVSAAGGPITLICTHVNDSVGYAVDKTIAERGGYAVDWVPLILGMLPYKNIHSELVDALLSADRALNT